MALPPVAIAFPNPGNTTALTIQQQLSLGFPLVLNAGDDLLDIDLTGLDVREVRVAGVAFIYDAAEMGAHDGVSILRSQDEKAFVSVLSPDAFTNVLDIVSAPTGSEVEGDRYIVDVAPTGDFAAEANNLAFLNGAGDWVFVAPVIGQEVYVRSIPSYYHWSEAGVWEEGLGPNAIAAASIGARELKSPWGMTVVSQTAAPPGGTPTAGTKYIVGASATGAWFGNDTKIAEADGAGGWTFYTAYDGAAVFNVALGVRVEFDAGSGIWAAGAGPIVHRESHFTASTVGSRTGTPGTAHAYSATLAVPSNARGTEDPITISYAAPDAGYHLAFEWQGQLASISGSTNVIYMVGLFRDSDTYALASTTLFITGSTGGQPLSCFFPDVDTVDSLSHTYRVKVMDPSTGQSLDTFSNRKFTLQVSPP